MKNRTFPVVKRLLFVPLVVILALKASSQTVKLHMSDGCCEEFCVASIDSITLASENETEGAVPALAAWDFLQSLGVNVHVQHGFDGAKLAPMVAYTGFRCVRDACDGNYASSGLLSLYKGTGVKIVIGPGSGANEASLEKTLTLARTLHQNDALYALEGPNEPNNFGGVTYKGTHGGGSDSWKPVAEYMSDYYKAIKADPNLKDYLVYHLSEGGAETDNCGLQFIRIPDNESTLMPGGTVFSDVANCHNYIDHPNLGGKQKQNQAWDAADPTKACIVDAMYVNYGKTWLKGFAGYAEEDLVGLPRVTTETGITVGCYNGYVTEDVQGKLHLNTFLSQFKRGWKQTFIYQLVDDDSNMWGLYQNYSTPRKSAHYMHNLTTILADTKAPRTLGHYPYTLTGIKEATHDLLLQKSDGSYWLVLWGEYLTSVGNSVRVFLPKDVESIDVYDPTTGITPQKKTVNTTSHYVMIKVVDHPVIIRL